jgi:hypothetical protein
MMTPTIHLNGTSGGDLLEQQGAAAAAIRHAIEVLADAGPNARDYYPQGEAAYTAARAEHVARLQQLRSVETEVERLAETIAETMTTRSARA